MAWFSTAGLTVMFSVCVAAYGQIAEVQTAAQVPVTEQKPVSAAPAFSGYKAVTIGTPADEVRDKLGKAEIDDKDGFYYRFSDDEFAQIRLDKDGKVRLLAITYSAENAPKFTDVFGPAVKMASKPDGSVYELVRYPEAGFWVAYSRMAGEGPKTTITIQKLPSAK